MYKSYFLTIFVIIPGIILGQPFQNSTISRGMGRAIIGETGIEACFSNPAGLSMENNYSFTAQYSQLFGLNDLRSISIGSIIPISDMGIGIAIHHFGFSEYNRQAISLSAGKRLMKKLDIGVKFNLINTKRAEFGNQLTPSIGIGLMSNISRKVSTSFWIENPGQGLFGKKANQFPVYFAIGTKYKPTDKISLSIQIDHKIDESTSFHAGIGYHYKSIFFTSGFSTLHSEIGFGFHYMYKKNIRLESAISYTNILGFTPAFGIIYSPKESI